MIYDRSETIWRLKTKFKGFESKGPFSTTYKLPLEVNNERIKTTLEVKIPLSYPNKQVHLKLVNPISHPWADDKGNVQVPPWAESLHAVELVSAFIEQLQEVHNKHVAPIQLDATSQIISTANSGNSSKCQCSTLGSVRPHDLQSPNGNIVSSTWDFDGTSPCTNHDTEKYDIQVNEMVLNACWNPPKGAMEAIKRANRDEMDYLISNEDIRWKILKNTPEMTPLIKELHKITEENETTALKIIAAVNKNQELLELVTKRQNELESEGITVDNLEHILKQYKTLFKNYCNAQIEHLQKQINEKFKAIDDGKEKFQDCYEQLMSLQQKRSQYAIMLTAVLG